MKKAIITLSTAAILATTVCANQTTNFQKEIDILKSKIESLEKTQKENSKLHKKFKKTNKKTSKKLNKVKAHDAGDNIKWDVDFRTAVDRLSYKHASGAKSKNGSLMTNRLLLGMKFKADENVLFYGTLGYNKMYGDTANHSQANSPMGVGYANFDWVTNENATDNTVKIKEAYWMYMNDTFFGANIPWTASIGRRPSTGGLGINFREGDERKSALAHTVNVEFDGASFKWTLDNVTPLKGSWFKLCMGRGLTNATPRFNMTIPGADYAVDLDKNPRIDMKGFIFVPYDDGQYSIHTNFAVANDLIGFTNASMNRFGMASQGYDPQSITEQSNGMPTRYLNGSATADAQGKQLEPAYGYQANGDYYQNNNAMIAASMMGNAPAFQSFGDMSLATMMIKADGLGNGISDYLDDTILFASYAVSKTDPKNNMNMLGSNKSETGHSVWVGAQLPCILTEDGRIGVEWNKGSKYWRSMTYGEDTMAGSKISARGTALEIYWLKPLTKSLSVNVRYTKINYDYTGSNSFFGEDGTPLTIAEAKKNYEAGMGADVVETASDFRVSLRYKF